MSPTTTFNHSEQVYYYYKLPDCPTARLPDCPTARRCDVVPSEQVYYYYKLPDAPDTPDVVRSSLEAQSNR